MIGENQPDQDEKQEKLKRINQIMTAVS